HRYRSVTVSLAPQTAPQRRKEPVALVQTARADARLPAPLRELLERLGQLGIVERVRGHLVEGDDSDDPPAPRVALDDGQAPHAPAGHALDHADQAVLRVRDL